ncbi:MAG TPA: 2-oxo acid dehydrogenase subunit E2 [Gemmataceae bacterium]|jgi:pyruvate dehydrogenase E2 component (dihydrolipoamide acetyltransferase)|nr:2-oxo acid dehydrogenase subunit E2 [Gemmataceae bacterium]
MASEVKLPPLGENVQGGDVIDVKVQVGDVVAVRQGLMEVEAEKSSAEVPSPVAGKIAKILVKKGDRVSTGQLLFLIDETNGSAKLAAKPAPAKPEPAKQEAPKSEPAEQEAPKPKAESPKPIPAPRQPAGDGDIVPAGPATRALARDLGVNLGQVPPTGPFGRVTKDDVKTHVRNLASGAATGGGGSIKAPPLPDFTKFGPVEVKQVESIRKRTAEHMALCWAVIPHVTQHDLADVTDIEAFRKQQEAKGPKLTVTAFVLKAVSILLKQFPTFNASLDMDAKQLVLKSYYSIGVAVDTERGLVVPVLRDVDKKSVHDIGKEMTEVAEKARLSKLSIDDMKGGTFTISNLGGIGGTSFTPIVNWPEVAILGLSRSRMTAVWKDGEFNPRLLMPLSLSYDHRVIDGADAARFVRRLAELLENPMVMLLHA